MVQREAIYATIRDLDFDYETGKLGDAEYQHQRDAWVERGIAALKAIDSMTPVSESEALESSGQFPALDPEMAAIDAQIEAAVASRRHTVS